ncbi:hypothetical protein [Halalkalibaculum sp. DA384]|uniref:hypothetical protein n=1 Tax=Halalkalibaculum sp. DA384 TaxID=3373606 RepID=UPI003754C6E3
MPFSKAYIAQFLSIPLLLLGVTFLSLQPVVHNGDSVLDSGLQTNSDHTPSNTSGELHPATGKTEAISCSLLTCVNACAHDADLPVDKQADDNGNLFRLSLSEWEDNQHSGTGMNALVFIQQDRAQSFLPAEVFSVEAIYHIKNHRFIRGIYSSLVTNPPVFSHNIDFSPLVSGIAINAP